MVIDVQKGLCEEYFDPRNNPKAEENIARLLADWRNNGKIVIHIHHDSKQEKSPLHPSHSGNACKKEAIPHPGEMVFRKNVNSAFIGTDLEKHLLERKIDSLTIVGLTTDYCVSTSVRMASNLGFSTLLVEDATATFDRKDTKGNRYSAQEIHRIHLLSLDGRVLPSNNDRRDFIATYETMEMKLSAYIPVRHISTNITPVYDFSMR